MIIHIVKWFSFAVLACLFITVPAQAQTTWYVDDDAPGDPGPGDPGFSDPLEDGSTAHPFDAIQEAINASVAGDTVLLLDGTYTGLGNRDLDFGGRPILLRSENGPENCVIDCQESNMDPHLGFHFHSGEGLDSILRGVTVQGAVGIESGGIRCENSSPTIEVNVILDNFNDGAGGGIVCFNSNPDILGNTISGNIGESGGGIFCHSSSPRLDGNTITDNTANVGGGIYCANSSPTITNNTISGNFAWNEQSQGGGICCGSNSSPLIANNEISGNQAGEHASSAGEGGGIYCGSNSSPHITNNRILNNEVLCALLDGRYSADGYGGGIACAENSLPTIANNVIAGNMFVASFYLRVFGDGYGAGIACKAGSSPTILNNTIVENFGEESLIVSGGGIYCDSSSAEIVNCVVWGNLPDEVVGCEGLVTFSAVQGGYAGVGNIDGDPLFIAGPDGCYYLSHAATGQSSDSPCVDAGNALASGICFTGETGSLCMDQLTTRIDQTNDSGMVDMGYHHVNGVRIPCPPTVAADFTRDPGSGFVPFATRMSVALENLCTSQLRRLTARIDLTTGDGHFFPNWRAGFSDVDPGQTHLWLWVQTIPDLGAVIGENTFVLTAEDVTAAPYNQPPYPPSGDMDTRSFSVVGSAR